MRARLLVLIGTTSPMLVWMLACAAAPRGATAHGPGPSGQDVREIAVVDGDGRDATLSSVLGGRPALVSLWAPWCEPCVRELPALERLSRAVAPCGGAVVGVAVGEKADAVASFTRTRALTYPQLADEPFVLADALGQRRIPATLVFDRAGRVVFAGEALDTRATAALARALGEGDAVGEKKSCPLP